MNGYVDSFIKTMVADGKSKCTISAYAGDLRDFSKYMIGKKLSEIRYSDLRDWVNHMEEKGLCASSRSRKIATVKSFFRYLYKMELIDRNYAESIKAPKIEKKQPKVISSDTAKSLLDIQNDSYSGISFFRDYSIVATFLFTGVRREELTNIKLSDINMEERTILIHGKGDKERTVFINDELMAILSEYVMIYRGQFKTADNSDYLFVSTRSGKLNVHAVNRIVNQSFDRIGIKEKGVSAHILRKRFATTVFQNTGDIATTSKLLGHSSPTVTMRYVVIDENIMRHAANSVKF